MPEQQLAASIPRRLLPPPWSRRMTWAMACVLPLCGIPAAALAQGAPSALRACAAEPDSAKRLACYDREMARMQAAPQQSASASKPALAATPAPTPTPAPVPRAAIAQTPGSGTTSAQPQSFAPAPPQSPARTANSALAPASGPATAQAPQAAASGSAAAGSPGGATATSHGVSSWKKIFSGGSAWHVTAQVTTLDRSPGAMVLHLDNGQVWRQVGRASGDLTLHQGDSVTIERHLGSYWLSSRYVSNMRVRMDSQQQAH